ncbi:2'-5' RNA ligase [filamentous cyanobacterium CCP5]|nr:2'-5' RNA ligase [filamentous cyanobacterium CCP5]
MESAKARYFVALLPPDSLQQEIQAIKREFQTRYGSKAALKSPPHITLYPPFLWPHHADSLLHQALQVFAAQIDPVFIELSGFGAFPPRVIYVDVLETPALMELQPILRDHLEQTIGIVNQRYFPGSDPPPSQQRRFIPHMTVAFRDLKPASFRQVWPEFEHRSFQASFWVPELTLLIHDGQRWQIAQNFGFKR